MKNANGTYVKTTTEDKEKTYMYVEGEWKTQEWTLPTIKVTLPTQVRQRMTGPQKSQVMVLLLMDRTRQKMLVDMI